MLRDDTIFVKHILDAAEKAIAFSSSHKREDLSGNEILAPSLVRLLEIIGEAANGVSIDFRERLKRFSFAKTLGKMVRPKKSEAT